MDRGTETTFRERQARLEEALLEDGWTLIGTNHQHKVWTKKMEAHSWPVK